tara:strand:- start:205 stop:432 length:228 start_codon:yes stop_codon:yes gene_type:complete
MFRPTKRTKKQFDKDIAEIEGWIAEIEKDLREDNFRNGDEYDRAIEAHANLREMLAFEHMVQEHCTEHASVARWA